MVSKEKEKGKRKLEEKVDDDTSGDRKRQNPAGGVTKFLDIAAFEAEDEENDSMADFCNDNNDYVEEGCANTTVKTESEITTYLPLIQNEEVMSVEELEELVSERYKPGSSLVTYAEDVNDIKPLDVENTQIPSLEYRIPSSGDPIIWKLKCMVGRERLSAFCLMQKYVEHENLEKKLQIVSAFAVEHVKGFLYVEAYKQIDVYEACRGLSTIYPSRMTTVPAKELPRLFRVPIRSSSISEGTWIRLRKGKYNGDLAQVVAVNDSRKKATLKLIPRIDLQTLKEKLVGVGGVPVKKTAIPAQKLISSSELEEFRPLIRCRKDRDTSEVFEVLNGMMLKDGYLYKRVPIDSIGCCVIEPSDDDLLKFEHSINNNPDDLEWLSELYGDQEKRLVVKDDKVDGEGADSSSISTENVFKVQDMVLLREKEFGFIISIQNDDDSCKVLTLSPEGPLVVHLKKSEIKKIDLDKKFICFDHHHKIIPVHGKVKIVDGPLEGRQGIVKKIYREIVFAYDDTNQESGGYFCCKSQDCENIKFSNASSKEKGGEAGASGSDIFSSTYFCCKAQRYEENKLSGSDKGKGGELVSLGTDNLSSSSKFPSSPKKTSKESVNSRKFKIGGKDVTFTVGQSLKIRMGSLKGYRCQIMALTQSEITVKLDSQHNILTVKPEDLAGVHKPRIVSSLTKSSGLTEAGSCSRDIGKPKALVNNADAGGWGKLYVGSKAETTFATNGWSESWKTTLEREGGSGGRSGRGGRGRSGRGRGRGGGRGEMGSSSRRGGGRGEMGSGRGGGRGELGRGRGGHQGEYGRGRGGCRGKLGRGGGRGELGRGRGGDQGEYGRGRGGCQGELGRGGGRGNFGRGGSGRGELGRGGGRGELGRGRGGGRGGKGQTGWALGNDQGGKELGQGNGPNNNTNSGRGGRGHQFKMERGGRGNGRGGMEQFRTGRGNGQGSSEQCNMGRGNGRGRKEQFGMGRGNGRGGMEQFRTGRGNGQGSSEQCNMGRGNGRGSKEQFGMGRGNRRGGSIGQSNMGRGNGRGGKQQFNMEQGSQSFARGSNGGSNQHGSTKCTQTYEPNCSSGRGGSGGGRGQFGRGISVNRGEPSGRNGVDKQKYCANVGMQRGNPSGWSSSQAANGWQNAAGEARNFSGASNSAMKSHTEASGRKRAAEMMADQTTSWGNKRSATNWSWK